MSSTVSHANGDTSALTAAGSSSSSSSGGTSSASRGAIILRRCGAMAAILQHFLSVTGGCLAPPCLLQLYSSYARC